MFGLLRVSGESLSPVYRDGDFVFICKSPYCIHSLKPGDAVLFNHQPYGLMIKIIERLEPEADEIFVIGYHPESVDSRRIGPINSHELVGKVICHFQKN